ELQAFSEVHRSDVHAARSNLNSVVEYVRSEAGRLYRGCRSRDLVRRPDEHPDLMRLHTIGGKRLKPRADRIRLLSLVREGTDLRSRAVEDRYRMPPILDVAVDIGDLWLE